MQKPCAPDRQRGVSEPIGGSAPRVPICSYLYRACMLAAPISKRCLPELGPCDAGKAEFQTGDSR